MDMKKAALAALGLAVGFVVGYGTGRVSTGTPINPLSDQKGGGYVEGYEAAKQKAVEAGLVPPAPTEARTASGTIVSVSEGSFVLETSFSGILEERKNDQRTFRVTSSTKVMTRVSMTPEERIAADEVFQQSLAAGEPIAPPDLYKLVPYTEALKAGDLLSVETAVDLLKAASADATLITVLN
jgi:hypothetical protein